MFTNNYQAILERMCTGNDSPSAMNKTTVNTSVREGYAPVYIEKSSPKIQLGAGTTHPKKTDYVLETPIDAALYDATFTYQSTKDFSNENSYSQFFTSVTNKSSEQLIVNECGLFVSVSGNTFMIAHEVFDSPKIFAPGETKSFVWKVFY